MYGDHVGSLHILVWTPTQTFQLWEVSTGGADEWQQQNVTLNHPGWDLGDGIAFVFVARRGNGNRGDTALDGVVFSSEPCSGYNEGKNNFISLFQYHLFFCFF